MGFRCLIVDDSAPFLKAARGLLERQGVGVIGVASTSAEALRRTEELRPDVVLVDIDLGMDNGFDLARQLDRGSAATAGGAKPEIILISSHSQEDLQELIADTPATGFLGKSSLSADAIRSLICDNGG
jgi:two-component system, NarL family, nitrate/nitrite response regulator NarL